LAVVGARTVPRGGGAHHGMGGAGVALPAVPHRGWQERGSGLGRKLPGVAMSAIPRRGWQACDVGSRHQACVLQQRCVLGGGRGMAEPSLWFSWGMAGAGPRRMGYASLECPRFPVEDGKVGPGQRQRRLS